jgi:hypothetical protein
MDPYDYIYILDFGNRRIQKWLPGASFGITMATSTMSNPYGMSMDPLGNIYVADTSYHRIIECSLLCRK